MGKFRREKLRKGLKTNAIRSGVSTPDETDLA